MSVILLTEEERKDTIVYNAKGDFLPASALYAEDFSGTDADAYIRFNSSGSISKYASTGTSTLTGPSAWVETGAGWLGGSNYGIYWNLVESGPNSTVSSSRAFANRLSLSSSRSFEEFSAGGQGSQSEYNVYIYNETTFVTSGPWNVTVICSV